MLEVIDLSNFILKKISFTVKKGEIFALFGPNGAGKTTILNCIAGFTKYRGDIKIDNLNINTLSLQQRKIGYLMQDLFLFPHLTVYKNITFGLNKRNKSIYKERIEYLIEKLNLKKLLSRYPTYLSGGEKQKVAFTRALSFYPKILLMDEPFNKLDINIKNDLKIEFKRIIKNLNIPAIFVTHNLNDAIELSDKISIIANGKILKIFSSNKLNISEVYNYGTSL